MHIDITGGIEGPSESRGLMHCRTGQESLDGGRTDHSPSGTDADSALKYFDGSSLGKYESRLSCWFTK